MRNEKIINSNFHDVLNNKHSLKVTSLLGLIKRELDIIADSSAKLVITACSIHAHYASFVSKPTGFPFKNQPPSDYVFNCNR